MTTPSDDLGGRLPLLDPHDLSAPQRALYDHIVATLVPWADAAHFQSRTGDQRLIGPFNSVLFSPRIASSFLALQAAEQEHTSLSERTRQVVILTVGAAWRSHYELYAHSAVARKAGLAEGTIRSLADGRPPDEPDELSEDERLAQRFVHQLMAERRVDEALYAATEAAFGRQGVVDILFLVGCYQVVCSLLNVFEVPVPT